MRVLTNEHVVLMHREHQIVVAGVTDYSAHHFDPRNRSDPSVALHGAPASAAVKILLAHQPRSAEAAAEAASICNCRGTRMAASSGRGITSCASTAIHRGVESAEEPVGVHESRHRILGAAQAVWRALRNHADSARAA
jgi:hypothetical protein